MEEKVYYVIEDTTGELTEINKAKLDSIPDREEGATWMSVQDKEHLDELYEVPVLHKNSSEQPEKGYLSIEDYQKFVDLYTREGLGPLDKVGEDGSITKDITHYVCGGYVTTKGSALNFSVPLGGFIYLGDNDHQPRMTAISFQIVGRCNGDYVVGSSASGAAGKVTFNFEKEAETIDTAKAFLKADGFMTDEDKSGSVEKVGSFCWLDKSRGMVHFTLTRKKEDTAINNYAAAFVIDNLTITFKERVVQEEDNSETEIPTE